MLHDFQSSNCNFLSWKLQYHKLPIEKSGSTKMSSKESMDLGGGGRRRASAPKAGSVWESRMKLDQVKGGIKVFKAADENSTQNTEIEVCKNEKPKQSPNGVSGKRKTWKSESFDGSPVKIAALRSELSRNLDEQIDELSDAVKKSPVPIRKSSLRKAKFDSVEVKARASVDEKIEKSDGDDEREGKSRSDEDSEEIGVCEEIKATVTSSVAQINGEDESDFDIEVENKSLDVEEIAVNDQKHKRIVIEEKKSVQRNKNSVPMSSSISRKQPPPAVNHVGYRPSPTKINTNSNNFPRTSSKLQSFVHLIMWKDVSKSAFVFGIGTFAIISSSYTKGLNISFISVLSYLGLVYLAAIFLFRSLISRGSVEKASASQDYGIGEEEAIWVIKLLLPFINEFILNLRALFSGDPSTTMKLAVLLFILARCGSSITIWTTLKLDYCSYSRHCSSRTLKFLNLTMSLAEDSPIHSSSSDDFTAILDAELDAASDSSGGNSEEVAEDEESSDEDDDDRSDYGDLERVKRQKVELYPSIINPQSSSSQVSLPEEEICTHPGFFAGMCMKCGLRADDDSAVPLKYIDKNLRLANDEMTRLRDKDFKDLLHRGKLCLVLDLDHTLLNSARLTDIKEEEAYLYSQRDALPDTLKTSLFRLDRMHMMTKLRPYVHTFLDEASKLFEMYIYTMGERPYALEMADILDPGNKYFHSRIIAQGDCTQKYQKGLDIVLGRESAVLILDDTEAVWKENKENLILMDRYHFFASSCKNFGFSYKSLSQLKTDESETEGALATVLKVLQQVHSLFFDKECKDNLEDRDVRQVLKTVRREVLKDCKIVFTRVIPINFTPEHHHLWRMAEQLGATCMTEVDPSVTHVVSGDAGTDKSRWAVRENKFLVNPGWIEASNFLWRKQPEKNFCISPAKCKQ